MENPTADNSYKKEKEKAMGFYNSINQAQCPTLNDYIVFNRLGFQHLIRPRNIERPRSEQKRRFALLSAAKEIIEDPSASVRHHQKETVHLIKIHGNRIRTLSRTDFWEFTGQRDKKVIKVIVRQFPDKKKHFLSVYEKKEKSH